MTKKKAKAKTQKRAPRKRSGGTAPLRMNVERVKLNRQGYDARGKYWGVGEKLFRVSVIDTATDIYVDDHVRASTMRDAKAKVTANMLRSLSERSQLSPEQRVIVERAHAGFAKPRGKRITAGVHGDDNAPVFDDGTKGRYSDEPINLEGLTDSELSAVSRSRTVRPELRELAHVFINARAARLRGAIDSAMNYEARAQAMYDRLPTHLRW